MVSRQLRAERLPRSLASEENGVATRKYAKSLVAQLDLQIPEGTASLNIEIYENDLDEQSSAATIHQLHWELLEDATAWGRHDVQVCVRRMRSVDTKITGLLQEPPKIINILHIAARDGQAAGADEDISPIMSLSILADINRQLKTSNSSVRLNIETVKPATLKQLTQCLLNLRDQHRSRDIHIIHLDVHGIADASGAALYLEETKSRGTIPCRSAKVAGRFEYYSVASPCLVLNACHSAIAHYGDGANTAKIFSKMGCAENILAMSSASLETAASAFLETFYTKLILYGQSFSRAACAARETLRMNRMRQGRFKRQVSLTDWFVPVVYSTANEDTPIALDGSIETATGAKGETAVSLSLDKQQNAAARIYGRDFDLSNLEVLLYKSRKVYLYGHAWIGKSAFLRYAQSIWEQTALADKIVYVDLADRCVQSESCLAAAILQQLCLPQAQVGSDTAFVINHISDTEKVLLIIDGLHAVFPCFGQDHVPLGVDEETYDRLNAFLKDLADACSKGTRESIVIFVGRAIPQVKRHGGAPSMLDQPFYLTLDETFQFMQLEELTPADAMELCQEHAPVSDTNSAELIDGCMLFSRLLLANPGAMATLALQAKRCNMQIGEFTRRLQEGDCRALGALGRVFSGDDIFSELSILPGALEPQELCTLLLIGLFWHQGPYTATFAQAMTSSFGVCSNEQTVVRVLRFASDRAYIRTKSIQNTQRISFIHPVFTVYCRAALYELCGGSLGNQREPCCLFKKYVDTTPRHLITALKGFSIIFQASHIQQQQQQRHLDWVPIVWFLQDVDDQRTFTIATEDAAGLGRRIQPNHFANHFQNTLTCLKICTNNKLQLATQLWPLSHLVQMCVYVISAATPVEMNLFIRRFDYLLNRLFETSPEELANDIGLRRFAVIITVNLLTMFRMHNLVDKEPTRWIERVNAILLDAKSNESTKNDPVFLLAQTLCDLATKRLEEYTVDWKGLFHHIRLYREAANGGAHNQQLADLIPRALQRRGDGLQEIRSMMTDRLFSCSQVPQDKLLNIIKCITPKKATVEEGEADEASQASMSTALSPLCTPSEQPFAEESFKDFVQLMSTPHADQDRHQIPIGSFMNNLLRKAFQQCAVLESNSAEMLMGQFTDRGSGLDMVETANNTGDWTSAIQSHYFLMESARITNNPTLVVQHIDEILRLLNSSGDPSNTPTIETFEKLKYQINYLNQVACTDKTDKIVDPADFAKKMQENQTLALELLQDEGQREEARITFAAVNAALGKADKQILLMDPQQWDEFMKETSRIVQAGEVARLHGVVRQIAALQVQVKDTAIAEDWLGMYEALSALDKLYAHDKIAAFILGPDHASVRPQSTWPHEFQQAYDQWELATIALDFAAGEGHLLIMERLLDEMKTNKAFDILAPEVKAMYVTEFEHSQWSHECFKAVKEWMVDPKKALIAFESVINRPTSFFQRIRQIEGVDVDHTLQMAHLHKTMCVLALIAIDGMSIADK